MLITVIFTQAWCLVNRTTNIHDNIVRHGLRVIQLRSQRIKTCDPPKHCKTWYACNTLALSLNLPKNYFDTIQTHKKPSHHRQLISLLTNSSSILPWGTLSLSLRFFSVLQGLEFNFMVYALHFSIFYVLHVIDVSFFIYI